MRKILLLTVLLLNCTVSFSQLIDLKRDYLSIQLFYGIPKPSDNRVGYMNTKGRVIIRPQFLNALDFHGDYANVIKDGQYGYVTKKGRVTLFPGFDKVYWYNDDLGIALKGGPETYQVINRQGELITPVVYNNPGIPNEGYAPVKINGRWNYIDKDRKLLFSNTISPMGEAIYHSTTIYVDTVDKKLPLVKQGLIDTKGNILIKAQYDEISGYFMEGLMMVRNNRKHGFIDETGAERIPLTYDLLEPDFSEGLVAAMKDRKAGFIDKNNNVVIPFMYDQVRNFSEGLAFAVKDRKVGYIDKNNTIVIPFIYDRALLGGDFHGGLTVFRTGNKYGFMNKEGKAIIDAKYDSATDFSDGMAKVKLNNLWGYINLQGKTVIPIKYKSLSYIRNGLIRFVK